MPIWCFFMYYDKHSDWNKQCHDWGLSVFILQSTITISRKQIVRVQDLDRKPKEPILMNWGRRNEPYHSDALTIWLTCTRTSYSSIFLVWILVWFRHIWLNYSSIRTCQCTAYSRLVPKFDDDTAEHSRLWVHVRGGAGRRRTERHL